MYPESSESIRRLFELSGRAILGLSYLKFVLKFVMSFKRSRHKNLQQKDLFNLQTF